MKPWKFLYLFFDKINVFFIILMLYDFTRFKLIIRSIKKFNNKNYITKNYITKNSLLSLLIT
jgi:hypothetical protein